MAVAALLTSCAQAWATPSAEDACRSRPSTQDPHGDLTQNPRVQCYHDRFFKPQVAPAALKYQPVHRIHAAAIQRLDSGLPSSCYDLTARTARGQAVALYLDQADQVERARRWATKMERLSVLSSESEDAIRDAQDRQIAAAWLAHDEGGLTGDALSGETVSARWSLSSGGQTATADFTLEPCR